MYRLNRHFIQLYRICGFKIRQHRICNSGHRRCTSKSDDKLEDRNMADADVWCRYRCGFLSLHHLYFMFMVIMQCIRTIPILYV